MRTAPYEVQYRAEGAPQGVPFEFLVDSASRPGHRYRLARSSAGDLVHSPACPAWRAGRRRCRHVTRALALADEPERTFVADVLEAWGEGGWRPECRGAFALGVFRGAEAAQARRAEIERELARRSEPRPDPVDVLRKYAAQRSSTAQGKETEHAQRPADRVR